MAAPPAGSGAAGVRSQSETQPEPSETPVSFPLPLSTPLLPCPYPQGLGSRTHRWDSFVSRLRPETLAGSKFLEWSFAFFFAPDV